ncbi:BPG_G0025940.mRNA.1.CDS.1 [Saccharomyces cerevisiae]|nr:BPG_G0025940.mRNA.1.CDS.1 [Saccharomyces cerevisiae]CAI7169277.1 BPG_G0025940.mRNA.1.CDS.1 [Saccharomyces cerevisiae]
MAVTPRQSLPRYLKLLQLSAHLPPLQKSYVAGNSETVKATSLTTAISGASSAISIVPKSGSSISLTTGHKTTGIITQSEAIAAGLNTHNSTLCSVFSFLLSLTNLIEESTVLLRNKK